MIDGIAWLALWPCNLSNCGAAFGAVEFMSAKMTPQLHMQLTTCDWQLKNEET